MEELPRVEIRPGDSVYQADEKVEKAFEEVGASLLAFSSLNTLLGTSGFCHFFQVEHQGCQYIIVVMTEPWDEKALITILNVLLEMRVDPDPPGCRLAFRFYSRYEVPRVFRTLFGDSPVCEFESRASLVARFGNELKPVECPQLAAAAALLTRQCLSVGSGLFDPDAQENVENVVCDFLRRENLPMEPLNSLIILGCLYGESLRSRLEYPSRWGRVGQYDPWPGLLFGRMNGGADASSGADASEVCQVAFNPVAHVAHLYKSGKRGQLAAATAKLLERCHAVLAESDSEAPAERVDLPPNALER